MKSTQIHRIFDTVMDKNSQAVAYGGCPAFLPEEKDDYLNQAFLDVVSNKVTGHNSTQVPFEGNFKRIADLQKLIVVDYGINTVIGTGSQNELVVNNYTNGSNNVIRWILVGLTLKFNRETEIVPCIQGNHSTIHKFRKTYNNDPWIEYPIYVLEDNKIKIYYDAHSMQQDDNGYKVDITFLKQPKKISYQSDEEYDEVPESVMYEIIDRAVVLALENIESRRTESKLQINTLSE